MKVFKFGGASINSVERIQNVGKIIQEYKNEKILIIISAMGKVTNELENVVNLFFEGNHAASLAAFEQIKSQHIAVYSELTGLAPESYRAIGINDLFTEVEWLLHDRPVRTYDYYYDQIVCIGELLSTSIVSRYLNIAGIKNEWIDVRDIFRTDDNFREATIDWNFTGAQVAEKVVPLFNKSDLVITQGFIGSTDENESTTLGREGSDFTAAVFANMLDAESQTIWKDVEGVMNADPKVFPDAQFISRLSYREVIEMAYYGAQVIHPKTIKPLQNKSIPLHVRCFLNPALPGTIISNEAVTGLPPIIVLKDKQVLLQLESRDFSFIEDTLIGKLHELFAEARIRPNLSLNGAITLLCCLDDKPDKIEKLALAASDLFEVQVEKNCMLLTIRHYTNEIIEQLTAGRGQLLSQKNKETIQILVRNQ